MDSSLPHAAKWLVILTAAVIWFMLPGYRDLIEPDEGRYAEIPREMKASGDWLTPRLNDFKYFEKPPLQYWMTAVSYTLFGESNATARLWVLLCGFAAALWLMYVGGRLWGELTGFYAFLVVQSMLLYFVLGHLLPLDMSLSAFMTAALGALLVAQSSRDDPSAVRNWMLLSWLLTAFAVLSKGLVGFVLPGAAVVIYTIWQRDWALWRHLHIGKGALLLLLVTAPWFLLVSRANPEFAEFFFIHEHFDRYTTNVHGREEALWYFLPVLLVGMFPWIGNGVRALLHPGFRWRPAAPSTFDAERLLWVYVVFILLFFSLGRSMLAPYLLPLIAPLALLAARQLRHGAETRMTAWLLVGLGVLLIIAGFFAAQFASAKVPVDAISRFSHWAYPAALIMVAGGLAAHYLLATRGVTAITTLAVTAMLSMQLLMLGYQHIGEYRSSSKLADLVRPLSDRGAAVYAVGIYPQSLPFYLGRTVQLAVTTTELEMGIKQEPHKWIADKQGFHSRWLQEQQAVAVFGRSDFEEFSREGLPMKLLYEDGKKVAVSRR